jgi:hypothetical protein
MINQESVLRGANNDAQLTTWQLTAADGDGQPLEAPSLADRTVTLAGDTAAFNGQTVQIQGSNDTVAWFVCTSPTGTALSFTAAGMAAIAENPLFLRPFRSSGGSLGAAGVRVQMLSRRPR